VFFEQSTFEYSRPVRLERALYPLFKSLLFCSNGPIFVEISHSQDSHNFCLGRYSLTHTVIMLVTTPAPAIHKSYSPSVKEAILAEAIDSSNIKRMAKKYNVSPKCIHAWKKSFEKHSPTLSETLLSSRSSKRFPGSGLPFCISPLIEVQLIESIDNRRCSDYRVTVRMVILEWMRIDAERCGQLSRNAIHQRIHRLVKRHGWVNRRTTHQAQHMRHNIKVITAWVEYNLAKADMYGIKREDIAKFDETNPVILVLRCLEL
jgi:uncharacterized protein YqiB (DUF1249 family)